jgi:Enoyl-[acyl-carrier-protein] reductase (NADH)
MQVQAQAERRGIEIEEMNARYLETISMRRKVTEEDVADLVAFLASPQARNISGQSLGVCGNVETMRRR